MPPSPFPSWCVSQIASAQRGARRQLRATGQGYWMKSKRGNYNMHSCNSQILGEYRHPLRQRPQSTTRGILGQPRCAGRGFRYSSWWCYRRRQRMDLLSLSLGAPRKDSNFNNNPAAGRYPPSRSRPRNAGPRLWPRAQVAAGRKKTRERPGSWPRNHAWRLF